MSDAAARADDVVIRIATPDDAATVNAIARRTFVETFGPDNTPEDMTAYLATAFDEAKQRRDLEDPAGRVWLAFVGSGEGPIGYAHVRRAEAPPCIDAASPVKLARLYVDAAWHGRGVAQRLMAACVAQANAWRGDALWLGVWQKNPRAVAFYERSGFAKVGTETFVLGQDAQTDWVMRRAL